ncbi:MAG TPA: YihY family inner membrane protein [Candidatus Cloacimonadota bacterium]|jgi:membrane protein|nr:YihY family inner membrane protein [Candidatus Cloacimonadota bacterium]HOG31623.1 YihY family inner membrane protein [Candidatus Cloacimonadota bacterium]HOR59515.1 YihY family inner membrane protein [Candidatus Cloacimonadota bacterium]HPB09450.1 YihY family inner membrane protein [Candidatus Cloacimonadota bacterium]HPL23864.1 YihY family inner membrane protein [Candidatus Cloacimonadota bacterium]
MTKKKAHGSLWSSLGIAFGNYFRTLVSELKQFWLHMKDPAKRKDSWKKMSGFIRTFYRRFSSEGILKESASLTYITILGFIPFLMFILIIAPELPFLNLKDKFYSLVMNNFIPSSAKAVNTVFEDLLDRPAGFNIFTFVTMVITSYSLFRVIRDTFDRILRVGFRYSQDVLSQLVKFLGTIILGLFIMILLFSSSSLPLISKLLKLGMLQWFTYVIPFLLQFAAIIFLYALMPSARVKRNALFRGAFWTTVIWVLAKSLFDFYIYRLTNYQAVYGVLATLPIFLMWIYVNWVIILGGIVLVSVIDNSEQEEAHVRHPKQLVKMTLEVYGDSKLNNSLEKYLNKEGLMGFADVLDEELE